MCHNKKSAYFAPLVTKPTIIDAPGPYLTRGGETVVLTETSDGHDHGNVGTYSNGIREKWHRSGRIYAGVESQNDIVRPAEG